MKPVTVGRISPADKWHAWIAHAPCALAELCVSRVRRTTTTTQETPTNAY